MNMNVSAFLRSENTRLQDENKALQEEVRSLRDFVQVLDDLYGKGTELNSDEELLPLLNRILKKALAILNAPDGSIMLLDTDKNELEFILVDGAIADELIGYRIPADKGIAGWVVQNGQSAFIPDVRRDNRFSHLIDETFKFRTKSILAAPLIGRRKVLGVIEALNQTGDDPSPNKIWH